MVRPPVSHVQGDRLGDPLVLDRHPVIQPDFLSNILVKIKEEKSKYPKVSTQGEKLYYNAGEDSKVVTWSKFLYMCLRVDIMGNLSKISLPITRIFRVREVLVAKGGHDVSCQSVGHSFVAFMCLSCRVLQRACCSPELHEAGNLLPYTCGVQHTECH